MGRGRLGEVGNGPLPKANSMPFLYFHMKGRAFVRGAFFVPPCALAHKVISHNTSWTTRFKGIGMKTIPMTCYTKFMVHLLQGGWRLIMNHPWWTKVALAMVLEPRMAWKISWLLAINGNVLCKSMTASFVEMIHLLVTNFSHGSWPKGPTHMEQIGCHGPKYSFQIGFMCEDMPIKARSPNRVSYPSPGLHLS